MSPDVHHVIRSCVKSCPSCERLEPDCISCNAMVVAMVCVVGCLAEEAIAGGGDAAE